MPDAVVVGAGPNGLAAAIVLARRGLRVEVIEGADSPGGGCRTAELTLPGYHHDVCSTVQALATASPFFRTVDLDAAGVRLRTPEVAFAHPLDGGRAGALSGSVDDTARELGDDARAYRRLLGPLVAHADDVLDEVLRPLRRFPRHPLAMARFGAVGAPPISLVARRFRTDEARGLLAGVAAHAKRPLTAPLTSAFALVLMLIAHTDGWPVIEGGSARLVDALVGELTAAGGSVRTGEWVTDLGELPRTGATLLDVSPRDLARLGGTRLPNRYRRALDAYRYGPAVCKVDWALSGPVPWAAEACRRAGTVHVGGTLEEVAAAESDVARGRHAERPFCIVVQPCVADPTIWNLATRKNTRQNAGPGAIHGIDGEFVSARSDLLEINKPRNRLNVIREKIHTGDFPGPRRPRQWLSQVRFDGRHHGRFPGPAVTRFELDSIPLIRIVAGSNHDAAGGAGCAYRKG